MKILIVKTSAFGDIVQSFDVLEYLKEKYPSAKVDWVSSLKTKELIQAHPLINKVISFDLKNEGSASSFSKFLKLVKILRASSYDIVFDLQGNSKSALITSLAKAKDKVGFGSKSISEWPNLLSTDFQYDISKNLNIRLQYLNLVQSYFQDKKPFFSKKRLLKITDNEKANICSVLKNPKLKETKILICPSAKWKNKELNFSTLFEFMSLINKNLNVSFLLLWGDEKEKKVAVELFNCFKDNSLLLDKLSLPALQNMIKDLSLVVAMDSCPLHLAGSVDVPSFSFFGPTKAEVYKPIGCRHFALQGKCPFGRNFSKRCALLRSCASSKCIQGFDSQKSFQVFMGWWDSLK